MNYFEPAWVHLHLNAFLLILFRPDLAVKCAPSAFCAWWCSSYRWTPSSSQPRPRRCTSSYSCSLIYAVPFCQKYYPQCRWQHVRLSSSYRELHLFQLSQHAWKCIPLSLFERAHEVEEKEEKGGRGVVSRQGHYGKIENTRRTRHLPLAANVKSWNTLYCCWANSLE